MKVETDYLDHKSNFHELLELQIVSIHSVIYFAAGSLGYGAGATIGVVKKFAHGSISSLKRSQIPRDDKTRPTDRWIDEHLYRFSHDKELKP